MDMLAPYILISNVMHIMLRLPSSEAICTTEKVREVIQWWGCGLGKGKGQGQGKSKGKGKHQNQGKHQCLSCSHEQCPLGSRANDKGKGRVQGTSMGSVLKQGTSTDSNTRKRGREQ
jgi:hypothetical protein